MFRILYTGVMFIWKQFLIKRKDSKIDADQSLCFSAMVCSTLLTPGMQSLLVYGFS